MVSKIQAYLIIYQFLHIMIENVIYLCVHYYYKYKAVINTILPILRKAYLNYTFYYIFLE